MKQVLLVIHKDEHNVFVGSGDEDFAVKLATWAKDEGCTVQIKKNKIETNGCAEHN